MQWTMLPPAVAAIILCNKSPQSLWLKTIINWCQLKGGGAMPGSCGLGSKLPLGQVCSMCLSTCWACSSHGEAESKSPWMGMLQAFACLILADIPMDNASHMARPNINGTRRFIPPIVWEKRIGEGIVPIYWSALILQAHKCYPALGELCSNDNENDGGLAAIAMRKPLAYITAFKHNNHAW